MIRRWIHPSKVKNDSPKVTPNNSRYTLMPHKKKNGQEKSAKAEEKPRRQKKSAKLALRSVLTQRVKPRATTIDDAYVPRSHKHQPGAFFIGSSSTGGSSSTSSSFHTDKRHFESQQNPSPNYQTYNINQAIAAGVPVIIAKDEAERRRILGKFQQEDEDSIQGLAATVSHPVNHCEWQNSGDKGKGKLKQVKGDKAKGKLKQDKGEKAKGEAQQAKESKGKGKAQQIKGDKGKSRTKKPQEEKAKGIIGRRPIRWFRKSSQ